MNLYMTQIDPPEATLVRDLAKRGWQVCHLPFREVIHLPLELDPTDWDLWIITSKQGARAIADLPNLPRLAVVGATTAALLPVEKLWFRDGDLPPSSSDLCQRLQGTLEPGTRVLFLCGDKARPLAPIGVPVTRQIVYKTVARSKHSPPPEPRSMVYFQAPSTVADYVSRFEARPRIVAVIGPTTASAVDQYGWSIDFQPSRPESTFFVREIPPPEMFS